MEEKGVGKEVEVGNGRKRSRKGSGSGKWKRKDENWRKKGAENVNEGARN